MKIRYLSCFYFLVSLSLAQSGTGNEERIKELDDYWAQVSKSVREGDFESYKKTCHQEGVLVSGSNGSSYPLSDALIRWEKDFTATKKERIKASVQFRFSKRIGDRSTAHETGIFLYSSTVPGEDPKNSYVHFEALLVKRKGRWKIMMEYQKSKASQAEWDGLVTK